MMMRAGAAAFAACLLGGTALAQESNTSSSGVTGSDGVWRLSVGGHYSTGDYGDIQDTDVFSVPVGVRYTRGNFSIPVSLPYVWVDGPGSLIDTPQVDGGSADDGGRGDNS